jgi:AraC-like DNA-binding protein
MDRQSRQRQEGLSGMASSAIRHLSTTGLQQWARAISSTYFALDTLSSEQANFKGHMDICRLGMLEFTRIRNDGVLYRRTPSHMREERESALLITAPSQSEIEFRQFSREAKCGPGSFVIERSDAPYEFTQKRGDVMTVVKIPYEQLAARIGNLHHFVALTVDARQGVASYFLSSLQHATRHLPLIGDIAREAVGSHLLELLCIAMKQDERFLDSKSSAAQLAHLRRAEDYIRSNLKDPDLSPQRVAEACGLSLRYLQRLFAEAEQTVSGYVRACRLACCHEELKKAGPREPIASIAYRWGFSDQAQFGRHYRDHYGCTPRETRHSANRKPKVANP